MDNPLPQIIHDEVELLELLTRPSDALRAFVRRWSGRYVVLGAGGKMGPTLCAQLQRAMTDPHERGPADAYVTAVSRFSDPSTKTWLEERGVRTISVDLLNRRQVDHLPDATAVIYLVGQKFGTTANPERTWAINTLVPEYAVRRYVGVPTVALSTGNVYPFVDADSGGCVESDVVGPVGEYANACLGRERLFEYLSTETRTPVALIRLNYALELRYGVLVDMALRIRDNQPIDITTGHLNCIWQGDANDMIVRALDLARSPLRVVNLTGPDVLRVRDLATELGHHMDSTARFEGSESSTTLISNAALAVNKLGTPATPIDDILRWTAHWVGNDGPLLGKPTHFEVRDGAF